MPVYPWALQSEQEYAQSEADRFLKEARRQSEERQRELARQLAQDAEEQERRYQESYPTPGPNYPSDYEPEVPYQEVQYPAPQQPYEPEVPYQEVRYPTSPESPYPEKMLPPEFQRSPETDLLKLPQAYPAPPIAQKAWAPEPEMPPEEPSGVQAWNWGRNIISQAGGPYLPPIGGDVAPLDETQNMLLSESQRRRPVFLPSPFGITPTIADPNVDPDTLAALFGLRKAPARLPEGATGEAGISRLLKATGGEGKAAKAPAKRFYHGTGTVFERPEPGKFNREGLFGPGYYLTDNPEVAGSYADTRAADVLMVQKLEDEISRLKTEGGSSQSLHLLEQDLNERLAEIGPGRGPNIRPVNVPESLNLFDVEATTTVSEAAQRFAAVLPRHTRVSFTESLREIEGVQRRLTNLDVYDRLKAETGGREAANQILAQLGYDGIQYAGGKRTPIRNASGEAIEHTAVMIFPESLPKIANAITGTPMGAIAGPAVAAVPQQEGESDEAYRARLVAAGVLTGAGALGMARAAGVGKAAKAGKGAAKVLDLANPETFGLRLAQPDKFYRAVNAGLGKAPTYEEVSGKVVSIPGIQDRGWLLVKEGEGKVSEWVITEPITGQSVARGKTRQAAIEAASNRPALKSTGVLDETITANVRRGDVSPRYEPAGTGADVPPMPSRPPAPEAPAAVTPAVEMGALPEALPSAAPERPPRLPEPETGLPTQPADSLIPPRVEVPAAQPVPVTTATTATTPAVAPATRAPRLAAAATTQAGTTPTDLLQRAEAKMARQRARHPEITDEQAADTALGKQIKSLKQEAAPTTAAQATTPPKPPDNPNVVPAAAPPPPTRRIGGFLPTADIEAAILSRSKGLLGQMTREEPGGKQLRKLASPATGETGALSLDVIAAGLKKGAAAVDPWLVATSHVERIPLIQRSLESTGQQLVRQAMAVLEHEWGQVKGVTIKDAVFTKGVSPNAANRGASLAIGDVYEYPGRYDMPASLRTVIGTTHDLYDDFMASAKAEGVTFHERAYAPGGHYFQRIVTEVRDIVKRRQANPNMARHYDTMGAGIATGVDYLGNPLALAEAEYNYIVRKVTTKRMYDLLKPLGRTPSQLIDKVLTDNAVAAAKTLRTLTNGERTVRAIRDGMSPTYQLGATTVRRPQIGQLDGIVPGTALAIQNADALTGATRRVEFQNILDNLTTARKVAFKDYTAAKSKRAEAIRGLATAEWADGVKFGLAPGTIGLAPIKQPFAQGRLFPRKIADYLNAQFNRETSGVLRGINSVSSVGRMFEANMDLGTIFINVLPAMSHPLKWAKAAGGMFVSLVTPVPYRAFMHSRPVQDFLQEMIPHGLTIERPEYFEAVERGGALSRVVPEGVKRFLSPFGERLRLVYEAPINIAKIEIGKSLFAEAKRRGELRELAGFLNNMTGTQSLLAQGIGAQQRLVEGGILFFSPRLTRSVLALTSQATTGGLSGAEARKSLASVATAMVMLPLAANLAQNKPIPEGFFDPTSRNFLSTEAFGQRVSLGGMFRSMSVLLGGSLKAAQQDPSVFHDPERMENPLLRFAAGRAAPGTSLLWDVASGRDFLGEPVRTTGELARRGVQFLTPMALQDVVPSHVGKELPTPGGAGLNILGLNVRQPTNAMQRDILVEQYAGEKGKKWADLDTVDRWELQQKHPDLKALIEQGQTERARRGDPVGEFWAAVDRERAPLEARIQTLTEAVKADSISGVRYRDELGQMEAAIARVPEDLKQQPQYQAIPLTDEQRAEYYKGLPAQAESETDRYLEAYYGLAEQFTDSKTGILDIGKMMRAREALKAQTDPAVVTRATAYINRNRDPEYVKALDLYRQYQAIPRFVGLSQEEADKAIEAAAVVAAIQRSQPPGYPYAAAKAKAYNQRPDLQPYIMRLSEFAKRQAPQAAKRKQFWSEHAELLDRYFGRVAGEQLAPTGTEGG